MAYIDPEGMFNGDRMARLTDPIRKGRWIATKDFGDLPSAAGCYVIYSGQIPIYVGSSKNLRARFTGRFSNDGSRGFDLWIKAPKLTLKYKLSIRYGDWLMVELRLIRRLEPEYNIHGLRRTTAIKVVKDRIWAPKPTPGLCAREGKPQCRS